MTTPEQVQTVADSALAGPKYKSIHPGLAFRLAEEELTHGASPKGAVKLVRARLHQVGAAYQERPIPYPAWEVELAALPANLNDPQVAAACKHWLAAHASTRERLPILPDFYPRIFAVTGTPTSLLDLACGLNPLTLPWMALPPGFTYAVGDIYANQMDFLNRFFTHFHLSAHAELLDLTAALPTQPAELALILKTLPCLEHLEKNIASRLLWDIPARWLAISYPATSLGGRGKGMRGNYTAHFAALTTTWPGRIEHLDFATELVFLLENPAYPQSARSLITPA
jgi:16S rRNA (guanine(1405)-N(7))-methyltransferase